MTLPFFSKSLGALFESWVGSAAAGPLLFYLLYKVYVVFPGSSTIGALPAVLAVLTFAGLADVLRRDPDTLPRRQTLLAMFGGVALFFVSLIFPLHFDREWITLGWALEGLALVWLFRRVPHGGLKIWGGALLAIAFVRLAINPAVLEYHPRSGTPFFNWYLYAYGVTTACLFLSARLWRSDPDRPDAWAGVPIVTGLNALGAVLLFLLMNIQIADYFSPGATLTFNLSGSLAQDLSYTLGWGLFGLALLIQGLQKRSQGTQRASFVLLAVTIGKLFLHDVWRLPDLYKVAAFVGLAVVLIIASFLFQKFLRARPEVPS
ncbi:MAG: DUF2339 domain-containing protein [Elusimicrobia bacterium]|nr:DUF2339 domain-containing protein [Elusimicrobiota bacterium]